MKKRNEEVITKLKDLSKNNILKVISYNQTDEPPKTYNNNSFNFEYVYQQIKNNNVVAFNFNNGVYNLIFYGDNQIKKVKIMACIRYQIYDYNFRVQEIKKVSDNLISRFLASSFFNKTKIKELVFNKEVKKIEKRDYTTHYNYVFKDIDNKIVGQVSKQKIQKVV